MICETRRDLYTRRANQSATRISRHILSDFHSLEATFALSKERVAFADRTALGYVPISEGKVWGHAWENAWFLVQGQVPEAWQGKEVVAQLNFGCEGLIFDVSGMPVQGLTNGSVFVDSFARDLFPLHVSAKGGESVSLWVETAANGLMGIHREYDPPRSSVTRHGNYAATVTKMQLAVFHRVVYDLWNDMVVLNSLLKALPEKSARAARILRGLTLAVDHYADNPDNAGACREILQPLLASPASASAVTAIAVGHAHIDTAWLWPIRESIRKSGRSFASQIALIEEYPDYIFGASQPAHYAMVKQHYPGLYEKIRKAVAAGRWELQGAMWVEADCNLISGESMVRQMVHGKNFFRDEFGVDVKNLWIPDVFGYSAAMPQIMKRAGVDYFLTQKLSWSQFNKFPYTTFMWCGIDGTSVLTHFPPENTYNSELAPASLLQAEQNFREKEVLDEMMVLFGVGDGGGGPKAEQIEQGLRQRNLEGAAKVKFGRADDFFARIAKYASDLPVWSGELYLELHRGTLTTQSRTKRGNRFLERALRDTEYLLSCGDVKSYPAETLDRLWKILLINQFHDIIPGSSIHMVYEQTEREHAEALAECQQLQQEAFGRCLRASGDSLTLINTLNMVWNQPIVLPVGWKGAQGLPTQIEPDGTVVAQVTLSPQALQTLVRADDAQTAVPAVDLVLENELVRYVFSEDGEIIEAIDKTEQREILVERGNVLTLYEDRPNSWDAWDIDIFYEEQALETARGIRHQSLGKGAVRQGLCFELEIGVSRITQRIYLAGNSKRLDFQTGVDWNERHRMLRVAFPTSVRADTASFDIQYGYARRNTHRNLSWDMARFEVAAHKYADLSDNDYGVALLNDCKYGHKVLENVLDLNLLRSPTSPDPDADLGRHLFTYSLLPHAGALIASDVIQEATQLNHPPVMAVGYAQGAVVPPVVVDGFGVSLEVLKKAEKEDCLVIRLVERRGCQTKAQVSLSRPDMELVETDLLEWTDGEVYSGCKIEISMQPFEIRTFKVLRTRRP
jgi:alpha-mannosidase